MKGDYYGLKPKEFDQTAKDLGLAWRAGALIFDNDTLDLVTHTDKKKLLHALREFSDFLKVDLEDRTTNAPYWIDMSKY